MDSISAAIKTELLAGLNDAQQQAVLAVDGPVLVVAGPGSGKTRVLTHRIAYLMEVLHVPGDRILAVTFTNKAAREMRTRIEHLRQGRPMDGVVMGTFHAFGARLLRENPGVVADRLGILPQFSIYDGDDQIETVKTALKNIGLDPKVYQPRRIRARISAAKSQLITPDEMRNLAETYDEEIIARAYAEYERLLRRATALDFDDLLVQPINLFEEAPFLLERYQERFLHILVDEYQDTNRVQYVLVSALAERHRNLFVVGDPDQSIYGWRQADIRNILDFKKDYPDATEIHLELNYRSTARIVEAADRVIRENEARIDRRLRTENADGEPIVLRELNDQAHEASFIADEVRRMVARGESPSTTTSPSCTAPPPRAAPSRKPSASSASPTRSSAASASTSARRSRMSSPYCAFCTTRPTRSPSSAWSAISPSAAGLGPARSIPSAPGPPPNGAPCSMASSPSSAPAMQPAPRPSAEPRAAPPSASARSSPPSTTSPPTRPSLACSTPSSNAPATAPPSTAPRRKISTAGQTSSNSEPSSSASATHRLKSTIAPYLERVALVADVDSLDADERGRVTLITLHSAKGLEFPVVFVAGVEEGLLPISRAVESEHLNPEEMEEERRLFYVGMTRAERLLYLTYASSRATYGRFGYSVPSRFLQSIPDHLLRSLGRRGALRPGSAGSLRDKVRGVSTPAATNGPTIPTVTYASGQKVFHPKFGEGTVIQTTERGGDQEVAVEFIRHGPKRLLASLAAMDVLD